MDRLQFGEWRSQFINNALMIKLKTSLLVLQFLVISEVLGITKTNFDSFQQQSEQSQAHVSPSFHLKYTERSW